MLQSLPESILLDTTTASVRLELPGSHLCAAVCWLHRLVPAAPAGAGSQQDAPQCAPLLQACATEPRGASVGWELRWHLAEAQPVSTAWKDAAVDLCVLQGEIHGAGSCCGKEGWKGYVCKQISYNSPFLSVLHQMLWEISLGGTRHTVLQMLEL